MDAVAGFYVYEQQLTRTSQRRAVLEERHRTARLARREPVRRWFAVRRTTSAVQEQS
jgi:hypothetical protein